MTTDKEKELYETAKRNAQEREVDAKNLIGQSWMSFRQALYGMCKQNSIFGTSGVEPVDTEHNISLVEPETNQGFAFLCGMLAKLEAEKGKHYQASFMKRGMLGIKANLDRKYDRIDVILGLTIDDPNMAPGETLTQTLGDLAVYCVKWLSVRAKTHPEEFKQWYKEIQNLGNQSSKSVTESK